MDNSIAHLLDSLGWAVTHSIWQGIIAAFAVYLFRAMTKDSQAGLRCGFELLALAACFFAFIFSFASQFFAPSGSLAATPSLVDLMMAPAALNPAVNGPAEAVAGLTGSTFNQYIPLLGIFWCMGFLLLASRYTFGFILTHRLRTRGLSSVPAHWQDKFETLVLNAGIFRTVALHVSDRVAGPVTLGFFKPIVLVPASFFTGLPSEQIEAILLHEIAHIRRHDYMINLIQTAIKTVLFFHPAVHYISRRIDEDREKACDDFAVNYTKDPRSLAKGLATLRLHLCPPDFAMAATSKNTPLIQRLTRLTSTPEPRRRPGQLATSMTAIILAAGLYTTTQVEFANAHPPEVPETKSEWHVSADKKNYHFNSVVHQGRKVAIKIAADGSRWVPINNSWHNVDKNPQILDRVPESPTAPRMPMPENFNSHVKFEKAMNQYRVNLDYYIASLKTMDCGKCVKEKLHWAEKQRNRVSNPQPDFDQDLLWKEFSAPTPEPTPNPSPRPTPRPAPTPVPMANPEPNPQPQPAPLARPVPVTDIKEAELAGGTKNNFYLNGKKYAPDDWEDKLENRLEKLEDSFEDDMDRIEDQFEDALDEFEEASEIFSEDPNMMQGYFDRAQANFATAVLDTNEKRAELKYRFNQNVEKIVERDIKKHVERQVHIETTHVVADVHKEAERARKTALKAAEREREFALREAEQARAEAFKEAERIRLDATAFARQATSHHTSSHHTSSHRTPSYENYGQSMLIKLKSDGILDESAKTADVSYRDGDMYVNGARVSHDKENNYCALNKAYNVPKTDNMRIEIRPQRITITDYTN